MLAMACPTNGIPVRACASHVDGILALQSQVHPPFLQESREVFLTILSAGCSLICLDVYGDVVAYLLAHPVTNPYDPPALNTAGTSAGISHAALFIHDVVVGPEYQGHGIGRRLVQDLERFALGAGVATLSVVALAQSTPFWWKCGFAPAPYVPVDPAYGEGTCTMVRLLTCGLAGTGARHPQSSRVSS